MSSRSLSIVPSSISGEDSVSGHGFHRPTYAELQQELAARQRAIDDLNYRNNKLSEELAAMKMRFLNKKGKHDTSGLDAEKALSDVLKRLGKYYQTFYRAFWSPEFTGKAKPSNLQSSVSADRYADARAILDGHVLELYECIPESHQKIIYGTNMSEAIASFTKGISAGRSTALSAARKNAASIYPTIHSKELPVSRDSDHPLSASHAIQALLGIRRVFDQATRKWRIEFLNSEFPIFPPLLFQKHDTTNTAGLFMSDEMIRMGKVLLGFIVEDKPRSTSTYAHVDHRMNHATPGFIAWVATATVYTITDDTSFTNTGVGNITGRQYLQYFDAYKRYIIQHHPSLTRLLAMWDAEIFPTSLELQQIDNTIANPITPQPTLADDPLAGIVARFSSQSITNPPSESNNELRGVSQAEVFSPLQQRHETHDYHGCAYQLSDNGDDDDDIYVQSSRNGAIRRSPSASEAHLPPFLPSATPTSITQPHATAAASTSQLAQSLAPASTVTQLPLASDSEPVPSNLPIPGNGKKPNARRKAVTTLKAQDTIVPPKQTRARTRQGDQA